MSLESIDTSYWLTKDKAWMDARKADWLRIEPMLCHRKAKKAMAIIKQYYLKGKMPKWEDLKYWDNYDRHLDILCFLWLHPSSDESVLWELYKIYMTSELIYESDAIMGYGLFLYSQINIAVSPYQTMEDYAFPYLDGKGLLIFNILYKDTQFAAEQMTRQLNSSERFNHEASGVLSGGGFSQWGTIGLWLIVEKMLPVHKEWLLQYDEPLEWWYLSCCEEPENYFDNQVQAEAIREMSYKTLYRIHHFDTVKEGETCRTRFVHKIRKMLDEREFITEFKQMWLDVKAGKIEVENPWER